MAVASERIPSLAEAINALFQRRLAEVHTVLPGRITKYTQATQLADVEVCVKYRTPTDDGDVIVEDFPVIPNVLVEHEQTSGFFSSFPVAIGDFVWLHIVEQSIDKWVDRGGVKVDDPIDRKFNLKDCFATLARDPKSPIAETESDCMVMGPKGSGPRVYLKNDAIALGSKTPASFVALATAVDNEFTKVNVVLAALAAFFNASPGPVLSAGPGTVAPYIPASVAATKVKAV